MTFVFLLFPLVVADSKVLVLSPDSLRSEYLQGIDNRMATFGQFPYGSYVSGQLAIITQDGCSPIPSSIQGSIYLIKRGTCYFVDKVLNAQQAGAKAVIIFDNVVTSDNSLVLMGTRPTGITIPSVFIRNKDGLALQQASLEVSLNLTFPLTQMTSSGSFGFVFSMNRNNDTILQEAFSAAKAFARDTRPIFAITDCVGCITYQNKLDYCLGGGRYCAYNGDSSADVLKEAIRQQCVYSLNHSAYLPYLEAWYKQCSRSSSSVCQAGLTAAGISSSDLNTCYQNSYNTDLYTDPNTVLIDLKRDYDTVLPYGLPTVTLWDKTYYGEIVSSYLTRAICAYQITALSTCESLQCSPGCWNEMRNNGFCDLACNTTLCSFDNGSCSSGITPVTNCSSACSDAMRTSGHCYPECDNVYCGYGDGACLCSLGCTPALLSNSDCDSACNNEDCSYDNGMCVECSPGCTASMQQSGYCFSSCNNSLCSYGNWSCRCPPSCTSALLANSVCDTACNSSACNYDNQLCIECSPGCLNELLLTDECYEVCDTAACNYSNWQCRCAPNCPLTFLDNDYCDEECDTERCLYDSGVCLDEREYSEESDREWVKPVIIAMSGLGGM